MTHATSNQKGEHHDQNTQQIRPAGIHRHRQLVPASARAVLFTDGAKHVADAGGAYWLLDEIALAQRYQRKVAAEAFQSWTLTVDLTSQTATLICVDVNGNAVFTKAIEYTDFPLESVNLWFENNTIYLPSER